MRPRLNKVSIPYNLMRTFCMSPHLFDVGFGVIGIR